MGFIKSCLVLNAVVLAVLTAYLYNPLPAGVREPWKVQPLLMLGGAGTLLAKSLTYLGVNDLPNNLRTTAEMSLKSDSSQFGDVKVRRDTLAGVPVIVYRPTSLGGRQKAPAVVFFHGGGFVVGCVDTYDLTVYDIAKGSQSVVISVDYRRAPEHPFPAAPADCLAVTEYVLTYGGEDRLNVDVHRVGVAGDSAGGNLAAVVALRLSQSQENDELPSLKFQVLYYPLIQAVDFRTPSYVDNNDATPNLQTTRYFIGYMMGLYFGLSSEESIQAGLLMDQNLHIPDDVRKLKISKYVNSQMLPAEFRTPKMAPPPRTETQVNETLYKRIASVLVDPLFCPMFADDVSGVPPAFIHAAEFDVLRDDALMYSAKLKAAGVKVIEYISRGGYHSEIFTFKGLEFLFPDTGKKALAASFKFMRGVFGN